jgi:STE24 endopeptidase
VLFDTLVQAMAPHQVVAVLAHELGHFKLHHVRWGLIRGVLLTGVVFYLLSLCLPLTVFYQSFGLAGVSAYGALVVFSLWFGIVDFALQPIGNAISRHHEFAADRFAAEHIGSPDELGSALLKLRETSAGMPLSHPLFSAVYHSHPPLLERLIALGYTRAEASSTVVAAP